MTTINWRIGVEIELLAPRGKSRLDLAEAIRHRYQGSIQRFFHPQSEPSKVPGAQIFHNLTLGYTVLDANQVRVAQCVDDLTLQADLHRQAKPKPGWYRIVSDDERLLRLIVQQANPALPLEQVMQPIAELFGTVPDQGPGGMIRVNDRWGASVAIAVPLPGERERPCELITPPLDMHQGEQLEELLSLARQLKFQAPLEGATHIHFDATALQSAQAIANLVNLLSTYGDTLKQLMGTNRHCRRLGQWPAQLLNTVNAVGFRDRSWAEVQTELKALPLTKYCDFNLVNWIHGIPDKNTIEVRILPVWLDSEPIMAAAALFAAILECAAAPGMIPQAPSQKYSRQTVKSLLAMLPLPESQQSHWLGQVEHSQKSSGVGFQ